MRTIDADRLKVVLEKNFGHTGGAGVLEQLLHGCHYQSHTGKKGQKNERYNQQAGGD